MPKISVVTPCYNSSEYIAKTFESVRSQSYTDWEWLIVDDCSTDNSFEIITNFAAIDSRIKVFKNEINMGASFTRNIGLEESQGEYVAFLDSDDIWNSEKLETQLLFMEKEGIPFSFHNYNIIDYQDCYMKKMTSPAKINLTTLQKFNPIFTSSVMIRRDTIQKSRFKVEHRRRQDYIFWYEILTKCDYAKNVNFVLGSYRIGNNNSLSGNKFKNVFIQWKIYRQDFKLGIPTSIVSIVKYGIHGINKYFL